MPFPWTRVGLLLVVAVAAPEGEHVREHVVGDLHVQEEPRLHAHATRTMATARRQLPAEGDELLARLAEARTAPRKLAVRL